MRALAAFLAQNELPEPTGDFRISPSFFVVMFGLGMLLGIFGHLLRSRTIVAVGVTLIFLATIFLPLALHATN